MKRRYFGTDGIRGEVGRAPVTPDFVLRLGWAAGQVLVNGTRGPVLVGKDTRISGYMFESALEAGLSAAGTDVRLLGPMPTPAVAHLIRTHRAAAGIVISASHNPHPHNGIKFFDGEGAKLSEAMELAIEEKVDRPVQTVEVHRIGQVRRINDAVGRYVEFCKGTLPRSFRLSNLRVVVDCAHGAAYRAAPGVFEELGAEVIPIGVSPDGFNINDGCGAVHPGQMQEAVLQHGADVGLALDGDGDRLIMADAKGRMLDGDELLFVIAADRKRRGALGGGVVGTSMTNLGIVEALRENGIGFDVSEVGDRHVLERLRDTGWQLGGEQSGHIICLDQNTTGDGIIAALQVLFAMKDQGKSLEELRRPFRKYPQVLKNVEVPPQAQDVLETPEVRREMESAGGELGTRGRVLVRRSGTEPVIRVMVEGPDHEQADSLAGRIARAVRRSAGTRDGGGGGASARPAA